MSLSAAPITGVIAAQTMVKVHQGNIVNARTTGFKSSDVQTADLFYMNLKKAGVIEGEGASNRPVGVQIGSGTQVTGTSRNLKQGELKNTNQTLDFAIKGHGYFAIALPNGKIGYTRDGSFKKDNTGRVVTTAGFPLATEIIIPENVPEGSLQLNKETGEIFSLDDPAAPGTRVPYGAIELFSFSNEKGLDAIGDNMLISTEASGEAIPIDISDKLIHQFLEESNVQSVVELTGMIEAQRLQELCTKSIRIADEMEKDAIK